MNTTKKSLPASQVLLTIELESAEWQKYWDQAIRKVSAQASIPGFRKGHVPESVIVKKFGKPALMAETIDLALPQMYSDAVQKEGIIPIAQPEVNITSQDPFTVEITISVMPEVTVGELKKLKTKKDKITASKKEVDEMITTFQSQLAEKKEVDRAAKKGDIVRIDFDGFDTDGVALEGTQSKNHPVEIGSNSMIPGFEDELVGLKKDEKKTFTITFPKDYHSKKFQNKEVRFEITLHGVEAKVLPEVNEDFVLKLTGTKKSVDELRKEIEESLIEKKQNERKEEHENLLLEAVAKVTTVELPQVLIDEEVEHLMDNMKMRGLQSGIPWEQYLEHMKKTEEDLKKELIPQAEKQVKTRLGIQQFIKKDQVTVSDQDIQKNIDARLLRMSEEQKKDQAHLFAKGERGWVEAENRVKINTWITQKLSELV